MRKAMLRIVYSLFWVGGGVALGFGAALWGYGEPTVLLRGGLVGGRWVAAGLAVTLAALAWRFCPPGAALRAAAVPRGPGRRALAAGLTFVKLALVGALLAPFTLAALNVARVEEGPTVHVDGGKKAFEPMFADAMLDALVALHRETRGAARYDNDAVAAVVREADRSGPTPTLAGRLWQAVADLPPLNDRLRDTAERLDGRVLESVVVVSAVNPTPQTNPWPIHPSRVRCRWVNVWPDRTPQGGDSTRVVPVSWFVGQDCAVRPFVSLTVNDPERKPPRLRLGLAGGRTLPPQPPDGSYLNNFTYHVDLRPGEALTSAELVDDPPLSRKLPPVEFLLPGPGTPPTCVKVALGPGLEALKGWPVLGGPAEESKVRWSSPGDADVTWVRGPLPAPSRGNYTGAVVEVVPGATAGQAEWRLERTPQYDVTPLVEVFPRAGVAGWHDVGAGAVLGQPVLVQMGRDDEPGHPVVVRDEQRWLTVVLPPAAAWPRGQASNWFSDDHCQAAADLLLIASSLARRHDGAESPPVRGDYLVPREGDATRPLEGGPERPAEPLYRQMIDGLTGRYDDRPAETPANSDRPRCLRWGLLALTALGALTLLGAAAEYLRHRLTRARIAQ
jgi:hypothetical protein